METSRMSLDRRRIYFNAVLGGLGGLVGWAGMSLVRGLLPGASLALLNTGYGLAIGGCIGAALGCTEGLTETPSLRRTLTGLLIGAAVGSIAGVAGLHLGEWLFSVAGSGVWPRAAGWAVFGMLVGTADGIARRMPARIRYGALGGLIGGLLGGGSFQALASWLQSRTADRLAAQAWSQALGLVLLGLCIGAFAGLVESLLRVAWLTFLNGRFEGQNRTLDPSRAVTTLGASDACNIIIRGDRSVAALHAEIAAEGGEFVLRPRNGTVTVDRKGLLPASDSYALRPGDRLHLGSTRLAFHAEERKA